ncbi:hypothetical protein V1L54_11725 [Streptomyces sp. TRM 70361]|uniref:hypothetical protein n=1 Tax=Streptomyces sp. TRM 70361 TaxID=3116553 RepID=UPI002E7BFE81|nr:hypothetical protein [Streptomyces sp. TRM 70361]MEE1940057.1 hypothetical protein [Streptomyces sp. TRM 70361]
MDNSRFQAQERFHIRQKVTFAVNRYVVTAEEPDGSEGEVVAFAQQKRLAFKEQVTCYTDESGQRVLCAFKARKVLDLGTVYDVTDEAGNVIGSFRKKFAASLLRSTWQVDQPGAAQLTGRERSRFVAVLRRAWNVVPFTDLLPFAWPYHFDFTAGDERVLSVDKKFGLRDRYVLEIASPGIDRRLAVAQAVALDALQDR